MAQFYLLAIPVLIGMMTGMFLAFYPETETERRGPGLRAGKFARPRVRLSRGLSRNGTSGNRAGAPGTGI